MDFALDFVETLLSIIFGFPVTPLGARSWGKRGTSGPSWTGLGGTFQASWGVIAPSRGLEKAPESRTERRGSAVFLTSFGPRPHCPYITPAISPRPTVPSSPETSLSRQHEDQQPSKQLTLVLQ